MPQAERATTNDTRHKMDSNDTACGSTEKKSTDSDDASIMSTVETLQSFTLKDGGDNALQPEPAQDVNMHVDTPTNEAPQTNEMGITSSQDEHVRSEVRRSYLYLHASYNTS